MIAYLWVAIGGALGSVGRFWLNGLVSARFGETFPVGHDLINVTGSFVIGLSRRAGRARKGGWLRSRAPAPRSS